MTQLKYVRADFLRHNYPSVYSEIDKVARDNRTIYQLKTCFHAVRSYYNLTTDEMKSNCRTGLIVVARQHFCWVVYRNRLDVSYPTLARYLNKHHTTIMLAVEAFDTIKGFMQKQIDDVDHLIRTGEYRDE